MADKQEMPEGQSFDYFYHLQLDYLLSSMRQIGIRARGTGGTFFRDYLATTTNYCFFPELFGFRNDLTAASGGEVREREG